MKTKIFALTLITVWTTVHEGKAVIVASGLTNNTQESLANHLRNAEIGDGSFGFFSNLVNVGSASGVHLGDGLIITAAHVGARTVTTRNGDSFAAIAGSSINLTNLDGSQADLMIFRVNSDGGNQNSLLDATSVALGTRDIDRHDVVVISGRNQTWGSNDVYIDGNGLYTTIPGKKSQFFMTRLDDDDNTHEGQVRTGDSGGGVWMWEGGQWQLSGINLAAAWSVSGERSIIADISHYSDQIQSQRNQYVLNPIPEPSTGFLLSLSALFTARRRRR